MLGYHHRLTLLCIKAFRCSYGSIIRQKDMYIAGFPVPIQDELCEG
jgi:hypothetical protein